MCVRVCARAASTPHKDRERKKKKFWAKEGQRGKNEFAMVKSLGEMRRNKQCAQYPRLQGDGISVDLDARQICHFFLVCLLVIAL
jgi:hypothetical protein